MELKIKLEARIDENGYPALFLVVNGVAVQYEENMELKDLFGKFRGESSEPEETGYRPIMPSKGIDAPKNMRHVKDIRKRDTVRCVKVLDREGGIPLVLGKEYSVLARFDDGFEVGSEDGRTFAKAEEIEFVHSNPPVTHLDRKMEETKTCDRCGEVYVDHCPCELLVKA